MQRTVLAAVPVTFKGKADGKDVTMYEVYVQADDGRLGSIFSGKAFCAGDVVELAVTVKDGHLRLQLQGTDGPISNRA